MSHQHGTPDLVRSTCGKPLGPGQEVILHQTQSLEGRSQLTFSVICRVGAGEFLGGGGEGPEAGNLSQASSQRRGRRLFYLLSHGISIVAQSVGVITINLPLRSFKGFRQGELHTQVTQPVNGFRTQRGPEGMGLADSMIEDKAQGNL